MKKLWRNRTTLLRNTFIISDLHFSHKNIIKYCNRPFKDIDQMDEYILRQFDALPKNSIIWNLGDLCMGSMARSPKIKKYIKRMKSNDKKLYLIFGNHDEESNRSADYYKKLGFDEVFTNALFIQELGIIFSHKPAQLRGGNIMNIHGHIHNSPYDSLLKAGFHVNNLYNVSADVLGFKPICLEEVVKSLEQNSAKK